MWSHLNTQPLKMLLRKVIKPGKMTKRHINFTMVVNFIIVFKAPIFRSYFYNTLAVQLLFYKVLFQRILGSMC